jgi:hypothetical protein|tara:strand:- start:513 stop:854 length:342 start_codon:yes stop_codon:yes gene_type:complete
MIKSAFGAVAALLTFGGTGMAGEVFLNPEFNGSAGADNGFGAASVEGHVGYKFDNGVSIQAGPAVLIPDAGDTEVELSGKINVGSGPLYGEASFVTGDELTFGIKAGAMIPVF